MIPLLLMTAQLIVSIAKLLTDRQVRVSKRQSPLLTGDEDGGMEFTYLDCRFKSPRLGHDCGLILLMARVLWKKKRKKGAIWRTITKRRFQVMIWKI
jgi:hypothetical protein